MHKKIIISLIIVFLVSFCGCGSNKVIVPDYLDAASFEEALNRGEDLTGKTVRFVVNEMVPNSALGYNLQAGEHLNFCSKNNPKASSGDTVVIEVEEISNMLGSYVITYKMIQVTPTSNKNPESKTENEGEANESEEATMTASPPETENEDDSPQEEIKEPITEEGIIAYLESHIETFATYTTYNEETDPNGSLGQPGKYYAKTSFWDSRLASTMLDENSGTFELFNSVDDCESRYQYLLSRLYPDGGVKQHLIQWDTILFRVSIDFTNGQAREYLDNMINLVGEQPKATSFTYNEIADAPLEKGNKEIHGFYTVAHPEYYTQTLGNIDYQIPVYLQVEEKDDQNLSFQYSKAGEFVVYINILHDAIEKTYTTSSFLSEIDSENDKNDAILAEKVGIEDYHRTSKTVSTNNAGMPYVVYSSSCTFNSIPCSTKLAFLLRSGNGVDIIWMFRNDSSVFNDFDPLDGFERILETMTLSESNESANEEQVQTAGLRPEFKAAMDSYEAFFDEYVEFMASFDITNSSTEMLLRYSQLMAQYEETMKAMEAWKSEEMTPEETAYYLEVTTRINQKLLAVNNN